MGIYNLSLVARGETRSVLAPDRKDALRQFESLLGEKLTFEDNGTVAPP
jgi:hypothetical protein